MAKQVYNCEVCINNFFDNDKAVVEQHEQQTPINGLEFVMGSIYTWESSNHIAIFFVQSPYMADHKRRYITWDYILEDNKFEKCGINSMDKLDWALKCLPKERILSQLGELTDAQYQTVLNLLTTPEERGYMNGKGSPTVYSNLEQMNCFRGLDKLEPMQLSKGILPK